MRLAYTTVQNAIIREMHDKLRYVITDVTHNKTDNVIWVICLLIDSHCIYVACCWCGIHKGWAIVRSWFGILINLGSITMISSEHI